MSKRGRRDNAQDVGVTRRRWEVMVDSRTKADKVQCDFDISAVAC